MLDRIAPLLRRGGRAMSPLMTRELFSGCAFACLFGLGAGLWLTPPVAQSPTPGFTPVVAAPAYTDSMALDVRPDVGDPALAPPAAMPVAWTQAPPEPTPAVARRALRGQGALPDVDAQAPDAESGPDRDDFLPPDLIQAPPGPGPGFAPNPQADDEG